MLPLFQAYPPLAEKLPRIELAGLPTPVQPMTGLGLENLYVKRDDLCSTLYGGNKIRKLEFLLGHARQQQYQSVLTYGCAGSNHALATALHATAHGFQPISILFPQPIARAVRRNLLRHYQTGAILNHCRNANEGAAATRQQFQAAGKHGGRFPLVIAAGGSSPLGTIGFVNAAFEVKHQIQAGQLPEPGLLYLPSGTMGTCIGLLLGFQAAQLEIHIMATAVTVPPYTSQDHAHRLFHATNKLLTQCDPNFPQFDFPHKQFTLRQGFLGPQYGEYTPAGLDAVHRANRAGIKLEGTYTGKALATLLADARTGALGNKTILFWDTYNSVDFTPALQDLDYHELPKPFHPYFEKPLQPLDQT